MRASFLAFERRLTQASLALACALLAVVCVLGLWQVVARFVLSQPSTWTEEAMRRLLIWSVMFGVVAAIRRGALVSVDLMLRLSRGRWRRFVRGVVASSTIAFLLVLVWFGIDLVWRVRFQTFASLDAISMSWGYAAIPVGAALGIVAMIAHTLDPIDEELRSSS